MSSWDVHPNLLGVGAATVAAQVLGALWFSPVLFAKPWVARAFPGKKHPTGTPMIPLLIALVSALVSAWIMAHMMIYFKATTINVALQTAFWQALLAWVLAAPHYAFTGRGLVLFLIDMGHSAAILTVQALVLFYFGW